MRRTQTGVSLDDNLDAATVTEDSNQITRLSISTGGLQDGVNEKLIFGATTVAANGSDINTVTVTDITVGGVRVNITYSSGAFYIQKFNYDPLSAAEAQAIIRDIQYQNTLGKPTSGSRTFDIGATDSAGNSATAARSTVAVGTGDVTPPTLAITAGQNSLKAGETTTHTFTFSEDVGTSFTADDISLESRSIGVLTKDNATNYHATYTPAVNTEDASMRISVATGKYTDIALNPNNAEATKDLAVDTLKQGTVTPAVLDLQDASDTGESNSDNVTSDSTPTFDVALTGTGAVAGDVVKLYDGLGYQVGTVTLSAGDITAGKVAVTSSAKADGTYTFNTTITDQAGNVSDPVTLAVTIDTSAPAAPMVASQTSATSTPTIAGTWDSSAGDTLEVIVDGVTYTTATGLTANNDGTWSLTIPGGNALRNGAYDVIARTTDAAGNTSTDASVDELTVNVVVAAPSKPDLDAASDTGSSDVDNITADNSPPLQARAAQPGQR